MYSVENMVQKPSVVELLAILPLGEWPVLRDGDPHGTANITSDSRTFVPHTTFCLAFPDGTVIGGFRSVAGAKFYAATQGLSDYTIDPLDNARLRVRLHSEAGFFVNVFTVCWHVWPCKR